MYISWAGRDTVAHEHPAGESTSVGRGRGQRNLRTELRGTPQSASEPSGVADGVRILARLEPRARTAQGRGVRPLNPILYQPSQLLGLLGLVEPSPPSE
jgi:hypothetical protein